MNIRPLFNHGVDAGFLNNDRFLTIHEMDKIRRIQAQEYSVIHHCLNALTIIGRINDHFFRANGRNHIAIKDFFLADRIHGHFKTSFQLQIWHTIPHSQMSLHHIRAADKVRHKLVGRTLIQNLRRPNLLNIPMVHDGNPITDRHRLFLIMRHIDRRNADAVLNLLDDRAHLNAQFRIEIGKRLIHQQNIGRNGKCPGQGNALLLTTGKTFRHPVRILIYLHQLQKLLCLLLNFLFRKLALFQAEGNIFFHGHIRKDGIVLKYHADIPLCRIHIIDPDIIKKEVTALNGIEARNHPQQRRLTAPGWTKEGEELTLPDIQR